MRARVARAALRARRAGLLLPPRRAFRFLAKRHGTYGALAKVREYKTIRIVTAADLLDRNFRIELSGRNVTPRELPKLRIPEGVAQVAFPVDMKPKRGRIAALAADNTKKKRAPDRGEKPGVKKSSVPPVAPGQIPIPSVPSEFRPTEKRGRK